MYLGTTLADMKHSGIVSYLHCTEYSITIGYNFIVFELWSRVVK